MKCLNDAMCLNELCNKDECAVRYKPAFYRKDYDSKYEYMKEHFMDWYCEDIELEKSIFDFNDKENNDNK